MQLFAFVDYDNVKPVRKEKSKDDVEYNLQCIASTVAEIRRSSYSTCGEVVMRLYGGWVDKAGAYTAIGNWLFATVGSVRGRRGGARMVAEIVLNVIYRDLPNLAGTLRAGEQKIVDTLLVADAVVVATELACPILFLSDDDDILPGAIVAARRQRATSISRVRSEAGINDALIRRLGVKFEIGVSSI